MNIAFLELNTLKSTLKKYRTLNTRMVEAPVFMKCSINYNYLVKQKSELAKYYWSRLFLGWTLTPYTDQPTKITVLSDHWWEFTAHLHQIAFQGIPSSAVSFHLHTCDLCVPRNSNCSLHKQPHPVSRSPRCHSLRNLRSSESKYFSCSAQQPLYWTN